LFVLGVALLVLGVMVPLKLASIPVVSVFGFLMMFLGALLTLTSLRRGETAGEGTEEAQRRRSSFAQRMEERFRRRFDQE
jgi:hypothetical protein